MKNLAKLLFVSTVLILLSFKPGASTFEGTIVYSMEVDGKDLPPEATAMFKQSEIKIQNKGNQSRTESKNAMTTTIMLVDNTSEKGITLIEMMGSKFMMKIDKEEIKKGKTKPDVKVKNLSETKTIAGYKCKKAEVTITMDDKKTMTTTVFYTDELPYPKGYQSQFNGLTGFPLEYTINEPSSGMKIKMTAKSVTKEKLDDKIFDVPAGYKEVTKENLQQEMMKVMQGK